jgi:pimeloyl-ACP methyl ester carboxylesterase
MKIAPASTIAHNIEAKMREHKMATYLLVHGAWHGGWCWQRVADRLRAAGHIVFTPTLTGLGERAHLAGPDVDLDCHINDVLGVVDMEELEDVILCGHSYGGQVITPVLDRRVDRFRAAVWLDAFVPKDGQSLMDGWPPERAQHIREQVATSGDGWKVPPMSPEYFGVMDPDDAAWITRRCVPQPLKTFSQAVHLTGAWETVAKKMYILAELHPNSSFDRFSVPLSEKPDWDVRSVASGHDVMVDTPDLLTEIFLELA